jgi:hypothetical protein
MIDARPPRQDVVDQLMENRFEGLRIQRRRLAQQRFETCPRRALPGGPSFEGGLPFDERIHDAITHASHRLGIKDQLPGF